MNFSQIFVVVVHCFKTLTYLYLLKIVFPDEYLYQSGRMESSQQSSIQTLISKPRKAIFHLSLKNSDSHLTLKNAVL